MRLPAARLVIGLATALERLGVGLLVVVEPRSAPLGHLFTLLVTLGLRGAQGHSRFLLGQAGSRSEAIKKHQVGFVRNPRAQYPPASPLPASGAAA